MKYFNDFASYVFWITFFTFIVLFFINYEYEHRNYYDRTWKYKIHGCGSVVSWWTMTNEYKIDSNNFIHYTNMKGVKKSEHMKGICGIELINP